jgi:hypothetical protein
MAISSILATTLTLLRDKLVDNSFLAHPLIRAIENAGNLVMVEGGQIIEQPVIFGSHSSITQYTNGFEPQNMAVTDPFSRAKFEFATFSAPIALSGVEKLANKGELAVVSLLESKVKNVMLDLKKNVCQQIIRGDVTRLSSLETLNGNGTSTFAVNSKGWLEGVARASQVSSVGALSKATYQKDNWFNQTVDAGGTLTLAQIDQLFIQAQIYDPEGSTPDILLMSPACYTAFLKLMDQRIQYVTVTDRDGLNARMVETYRGAQIYVDPYLGFTANASSGMGAKKVSAYLLNSKNFQLHADTDGWFKMGDLALIPGSIVEAATVMCRMQLVTGHLASHGILIDAEA